MSIESELISSLIRAEENLIAAESAVEDFFTPLLRSALEQGNHVLVAEIIRRVPEGEVKFNLMQYRKNFVLAQKAAELGLTGDNK